MHAETLGERVTRTSCPTASLSVSLSQQCCARLVVAQRCDQSTACTPLPVAWQRRVVNAARSNPVLDAGRWRASYYAPVHTQLATLPCRRVEVVPNDDARLATVVTRRAVADDAVGERSSAVGSPPLITAAACCPSDTPPLPAVRRGAASPLRAHLQTLVSPLPFLSPIVYLTRQPYCCTHTHDTRAGLDEDERARPPPARLRLIARTPPRTPLSRG